MILTSLVCSRNHRPSYGPQRCCPVVRIFLPMAGKEDELNPLGLKLFFQVQGLLPISFRECTFFKMRQESANGLMLNWFGAWWFGLRLDPLMKRIVT